MLLYPNKPQSCQSLVGSVIIGVEIGRKGHIRSSTIVIGRKLKPLDTKIDLELDLTGCETK
jgi:hypothetical protein